MKIIPRLDTAQRPAHPTHCGRGQRALLLWASIALATQAAAGEPGQNVAVTPEQKFQMALEAQTAREYRTMMTLLRQSAEAGNMGAQEMLGIALLVGQTLYGNTVKTDRCEAGAWMRRAVAQGSEISKHQLDFLNRLRQAPSGKDVCLAVGG